MITFGDLHRPLSTFGRRTMQKINKDIEDRLVNSTINEKDLNDNNRKLHPK